MKCQHMTDSGQCEKEATRDIRVVTTRRGWKIFLCSEHVEIEMEKLRKVVDQIAHEEVNQEQKG
jgi:hypothetical protein